jgi:hypothetical protein
MPLWRGDQPQPVGSSILPASPHVVPLDRLDKTALRFFSSRARGDHADMAEDTPSALTASGRAMLKRETRAWEIQTTAIGRILKATVGEV